MKYKEIYHIKFNVGPSELRIFYDSVNIDNIYKIHKIKLQWENVA